MHCSRQYGQAFKLRSGSLQYLSHLADKGSYHVPGPLEECAWGRAILGCKAPVLPSVHIQNNHSKPMPEMQLRGLFSVFASPTSRFHLGSDQQ